MTNWLITGVSSGLGAALARAALARGDWVAGTVRKTQDLAAFEALAPCRALGLMLDVTDESALKAAVDRAEQASGGLDVLVNNAGYGLVGAVEEASLAEARAQFEVNLFAPLTAIQSVLPYMRARRAGRIVSITSVSGLATWAGTGIYCASKFALEGLAETLAAEVAPLGIRVSNVAPGGMRTAYAGRSLVQAARRIADYEDGPGRAASRILADHAGSEPGDPVKVAAAILNLVDDPDPPVHLLLGADALGYAEGRITQLQAEIAAWRAVSLSTGFDQD
ncbi:oxidoreductase [Phenylobacterium montanum]|uniref:SDR family NAD(P)-dependent oxidoreductase n=1 Tax=Phenylobacterium montanum TaxID=2823693 RepID=A0A975FXD1_9CAUL|nr:oxidoreductase [Caulobacter sp. S6]QUD87155.1 SDR family NAD(P)-dependent oxidoreductase [Caulobacter sp. S6]